MCEHKSRVFLLVIFICGLITNGTLSYQVLIITCWFNHLKKMSIDFRFYTDFGQLCVHKKSFWTGICQVYLLLLLLFCSVLVQTETEQTQHLANSLLLFPFVFGVGCLILDHFIFVFRDTQLETEEVYKQCLPSPYCTDIQMLNWQSKRERESELLMLRWCYICFSYAVYALDNRMNK